MDKQAIASAIIAKVSGGSFSAWRIGLTHTPRERRTEHERNGENTQFWTEWRADSLGDAQEIESYFINRQGMKGGTGGNLEARYWVYVYIF